MRQLLRKVILLILNLRIIQAEAAMQLLSENPLYLNIQILNVQNGELDRWVLQLLLLIEQQRMVVIADTNRFH
jgi:hypothetical protein